MITWSVFQTCPVSWTSSYCISFQYFWLLLSIKNKTFFFFVLKQTKQQQQPISTCLKTTGFPTVRILLNPNCLSSSYLQYFGSFLCIYIYTHTFKEHLVSSVHCKTTVFLPCLVHVCYLYKKSAVIFTFSLRNNTGERYLYFSISNVTSHLYSLLFQQLDKPSLC